MYTIYADDKLLYATSLYDKNYTVFDPVINYELNRAATCIPDCGYISTK